MQGDTFRDLVLCDFGFATLHAKEDGRCLSEMTGTPYYIAPEVLECASPSPGTSTSSGDRTGDLAGDTGDTGDGGDGQHRYDHGCDVWSAGAVAFQMLSGFPPYLGKDVDEIFANIKAGDLDAAMAFDEWDDVRYVYYIFQSIFSVCSV